METQRTRPIYKAYCKVSRKADQDEIFPNYFSFPPKAGDLVQSQSGTVYKIISVMHTAKIIKGKYGDRQSPKALLGLEKL